MKKPVLISILAGTGLVLAAGTFLLVDKPQQAPSAPPAPENAALPAEDPGSLAAADDGVPMDLPPPEDVGVAAGDPPAEVQLPPPGEESATAGEGEETGALKQRIKELEGQVAKLREDLAKRSTAPAKAKGETREAARPQEAGAIRLTHGPFRFDDSQVKTFISWSGKTAPVLTLHRQDARTFILTAANTRAPDHVPLTPYLEQTEMLKQGRDRQFVYRGFGPIDAGLVRGPKGAELVLTAEQGFPGAPRSVKIPVAKPGPEEVAADSTRWFVRAISVNTAVMGRLADNATLPVSVGSQLAGCGVVKAIYPETLQVKTDCGLLGIRPASSTVQ